MELPTQAPVSKKRHMRTKDSGSGPSNVQRRSEELPHARNVSGVATQPPSRPSFDSISLPSAGFQHQDFGGGLQDLLPLDLGSRTTPDSTSTGGASVPQHQAYAGNPAAPVGTPSSLNKLGALMFPSEDPFAYPNQPMMELGLQQKMQQAPMQGQEAVQDGNTAPFFMQGSFDEMESHLLGQIPPFMVEQAQQGGLEMPVHMFGSSGVSAGSVPAPVPGGGAARGGREGAQGGGMDRERMEQLRRQQEQIIAAQRFRDWGQFGRGNFQM